MSQTIRVLFDITVLMEALDAMDSRPGSQDDSAMDSALVLQAAADRLIEGYLSASAIEPLSELLHHAYGERVAREQLHRLREALGVAMVNATVMDAALAHGWRYFDDALTYECARANGLDALVTLNVEDFAETVLLVQSPRELLERLAAEQQQRRRA